MAERDRQPGNPDGLPRPDEIVEDSGIGQLDITDGGSAPVKEFNPPLQTAFRQIGEIAVAVIAVFLLAVPVLWALGVLLFSVGVLGPGFAPPAWDWLIAAAFILLAGAVGLLFIALFGHSFGEGPTTQ
jgi:hypothetical protein